MNKYINIKFTNIKQEKNKGYDYHDRQLHSFQD